MGRRKTSSTCGLPGHQVHSPDGPWTAGRPPEESWECTSFGICKQLSLEHNMVKSPPLGVRDMITIFRKFYKKIIDLLRIAQLVVLIPNKWSSHCALSPAGSTNI